MIVLDASVIAKWFIKEERSEEALRFQKLHLKGEQNAIVPTVAMYELANLFRFKEDFTDKDVKAALRALEDFDIKTFHFDFEDMTRVAIFAKERDITVYDSTYVVLALNLDCELITADQPLFRKTKDLGIVKSL